MDPYLEAPTIWPNVHTSLMTIFQEQWPGFAKDILIDIAAEEIPLLFPVIGNAMRLLNVAADLAQIMETIGEVVTNPDG